MRAALLCCRISISWFDRVSKHFQLVRICVFVVILCGMNMLCDCGKQTPYKIRISVLANIVYEPEEPSVEQVLCMMS